MRNTPILFRVKVSVHIMNLVSFDSNEVFFKIKSFLFFNISLLLFYVSDVQPARMYVCQIRPLLVKARKGHQLSQELQGLRGAIWGARNQTRVLQKNSHSAMSPALLKVTFCLHMLKVHYRKLRTQKTKSFHQCPIINIVISPCVDIYTHKLYF